jgi:hypothetical protein
MLQMMVMRPHVLLVFLVITACSARAQVDPSIADDFFKKKNYIKAIPEYKKLLKYDREQPDWNYSLGICYLSINIDRKNAVHYMQRAFDHEKAPKDAGYYLGVALMLNYEFEKAQEVLEKYISSEGKMIAEAQKALKDCFTARELMKNPIQVRFDNMGSQINSEFPDYYPFITGDEEQLAYTTRRKVKGGVEEFDGYYASEIFFSSFDGAQFSMGRDAGEVNTKYNEQCTGFTPDGETMVMYSDYIPAGEIFIVDKESNRFDKKKKVVEIDEEKVLESAAIISPDRNTLVYSSNRGGGKGGLDLYMVRKLPDGTWGLPQAVGGGVNTSGDEDFPVFNPEGTKLYFSSNGHPGMGGFDVYEITWDSETNEWGSVTNIGYPVNTPDHERSISFANDGKHAYMAADREGGFGDLDIYRLTFDDVEVRPALFKFKVKTTDTENPFVQADFFTIYDKDENIVGDYLPNPETMEYTVILKPGEYRLEVEYTGVLVTEAVVVNEFMNRLGEIVKFVNIGAQP